MMTLPDYENELAQPVGTDTAALLRAAEIETFLGAYDIALQRLAASLEKALEANDHPLIARCHLARGRAELAAGRGDRAETYLSKGASLALSTGDPALQSEARILGARLTGDSLEDLCTPEALLVSARAAMSQISLSKARDLLDRVQPDRPEIALEFHRIAAELALFSGDAAESRRQDEKARALIDAIAAKLSPAKVATFRRRWDLPAFLDRNPLLAVLDVLPIEGGPLPLTRHLIKLGVAWCGARSVAFDLPPAKIRIGARAEGSALEESDIGRMERGQALNSIGRIFLEAPTADEGFIAGFVAGAARRLELALRLDHSNRDSLTGLLSHTAFQKKLEERVTTTLRGHRPLLLLLVGLDRMRVVNDRLGFDAGDKILIEASDLCRNFASGRGGVAGRYGGDLFEIVLEPGPKNAAEVAGELVTSVRHHTFLRDVSITISVGTAQAPDDAQTARDLLLLAERALERARREGGDRAGGVKAQEDFRDAKTETAILTRIGRTALAMLDRVLSESHDLEAALTTSLEMMARATGAEVGSIALFDENGSPSFGASYPPVLAQEPPLSRAALERVRREGRPVRVAEAQQDEWGAQQKSIREFGIRDILAVPLLHQGKAIGAVYLDRRQTGGGFKDDHAALLQEFASRVAPFLQGSVDARRGGLQALDGGSYDERIERLDRMILEKALRNHEGSIQATAVALGLEPEALRTKLARHGLAFAE